MDDFNIEDYKIQKTEMTNGDAVDGLENIVKFLEDTHRNHFLLGAARRLLDDTKKEDPNAQANFLVTNFVEEFGSPEMMDKLSGSEEKTEDTCDWIRANDTYSMRDVPESAPSKFRALCEEEIAKFKDVQG